jgi:hypothetical protein
MKAKDIKFVFTSVALVVSLACCVSLTKSAISASLDTGIQSKKVEEKIPDAIIEEDTGLGVVLKDKGCDKAIVSIQEQSANIDEGMSEIKKDLEELKKRKKIKKVTKKKIKTKKVIDK